MVIQRRMKMYEILAGLFAVILIAAVIGMFKFGFNIVFLYILLFSLVVVVWSVAAALEEKKRKNSDDVQQ